MGTEAAGVSTLTQPVQAQAAALGQTAAVVDQRTGRAGLQAWGPQPAAVSRCPCDVWLRRAPGSLLTSRDVFASSCAHTNPCRHDLARKAETADVMQWLDTKADAQFVEQVGVRPLRLISCQSSRGPSSARCWPSWMRCHASLITLLHAFFASVRAGAVRQGGGEGVGRAGAAP